MAFLLDAILAILALLIVVVYAKRGAVKSIYGVLSLAVSIGAAFLLGPIVGSMLIKPFFSGAENAVYDVLLSVTTTAEEGLFDIGALFGQLPQELSDLITRCGVDLASLQESFGSMNLATEADLQSLAHTIAEPITEYISQAFGCVGVFLVVSIVLRLLKGILCPLVKFPLIKQADGLIGALLGVVAAVVYVWVICIAISALVEYQFLGEYGDMVVSLAETSAIFRFFCTISPMDLVNIVSVFE